jgi:hypothetical protein
LADDPPDLGAFDPDALLVSVIPRRDVPALHRPGYRPSWWKDRTDEPTFDWRHPRGTAQNRAGTRALAHVVTLREALTTFYETHAHGLLYVLYGPDDRPVSPHPRLTKDSLEWLREQGFSVRCPLLWVDIDNPKTNGKKTPWTPETKAADQALRASKEVLRTAGFYYTRNGARIVQPLATPLEPEDLEDALHAWLHELAMAGLCPDERCKDWTHIFLLPRVMRLDDGVASRSDSDAEMPTRAIVPPRRVLDFSDLPPVTDSEVPSHAPRVVKSRLPRPKRQTTIEFLPLPVQFEPFVAHVATAIAEVNPTGYFHDLALCVAGWLCQRGVVHRACVPAITREILAQASTLLRIPKSAVLHHTAGVDTVARFESGETVKGEHALHALFPRVAQAIEQALGLIASPPPADGDTEQRVAPTLLFARNHQSAWLNDLKHGVNALASQPGLGKSYATRELMLRRLHAHLDLPEALRTRTTLAHAKSGVTAPTHDLAREYVRELRAALGDGPEAHALVARVYSPASLLHASGTHVCRYPEQAQALQAAGLSMAYELCDGRHKHPCEYRDRCAAYGGIDGESEALIQIGVHPHVGRMTRHVGAHGLLVLDEPPSTILTHALTASALAQALAFEGLGRRYAAALRPALTTLWHALKAGFDGPLEVPEMMRVGVGGVDFDDLCRAMIATDTPNTEDPVEIVTACALGAHEPEARSQAPNFAWPHIARAKAQPAYAATLRDVGATYDAVYRTLVAEVEHRARDLAKNADLATNADQPTTPRCWIDRDATPEALVIKRFDDDLTEALNHDGVTLVLDGSLEASKELYELATGGKFPTLRVEAPDGAKITRVHKQMPCSRRTWFKDKVPVWTGPLNSALSELLLWIKKTVAPSVLEVTGRSVPRVGLITYRAVHLALEALLDPAKVASGPPDGLTVADLEAARATWGGMGWESAHWTMGHYGAIRGVNSFAEQDLDALATIGDPRSNLGDVVRECQLIAAFDPDLRMGVLCNAEVEQAQERFRSVTRTRLGYLLHVGSVPPRYWGGRYDLE